MNAISNCHSTVTKAMCLVSLTFLACYMGYQRRGIGQFEFPFAILSRILYVVPNGSLQLEVLHYQESANITMYSLSRSLFNNLKYSNSAVNLSLAWQRLNCGVYKNVLFVFSARLAHSGQQLASTPRRLANYFTRCKHVPPFSI